MYIEMFAETLRALISFCLCPTSEAKQHCLMTRTMIAQPVWSQRLSESVHLYLVYGYESL